ncbi:MAG: fibronectin type III domain-containing protein, partial [Caldilineaceae bacterium]|nr:fibronectin type III domain-containing protein [Caldilineaceae bacterium]
HMAERSAAAQSAIGNFWSSGSGDTWSTELITTAQSILNATTVAEAQGFTAQLLGFSSRIALGTDLDDDGIEPIPGEGGALTVYETAQEAADYFPEAQLEPTPTSTPSATPTATSTSTAPTATPTATSGSPATGDSFEDDDVCVNARTIATNGTLQTRTFHDEGDTDWVRFDAEANQTYVIKIENLGADSDAVVFLYDVCNGPADDQQDNAFGTTVTLEWDATKNGTYFIELRQFDPTQFGADTNYRISVTADQTPPATPKNPRCVAFDATSQAVQWDRSPERDVVGYRLSYTRRGGGDSGVRTIEGADTTFYKLENLTTNATYDVELRAIDFSENLSSPTAPALPCTVVAPADDTKPSATVQQPTAGTVFTSTAEMITVGGLAQDNGNNLSRVNVRNLTNNQEGWDFSLTGSSAQFRVEDVPLAAGANQIRVTVFDEANNTTEQTVTVNRLAGQGGAVIIIAGQNETLALQTNIYNSTNRAYRVFESGGFSDDDIYYIAPAAQDADNDGTPDTDALATPAEIEEAITVWAKSRVGPGKPLFIYMMDHGLENKFCVTGCGAGKVITPDDLDGWLRTLETDTGVTEVTVIYEACLSGSFIQREGATGSISKLNRVIITSTGADNNAYASAQGAYFSDAFFSCVVDSNNLNACFTEAKSAVLATGVNQTPFLDDNGDGVYDPAQDGAVAQNRVVTRFFGSVRPVIKTANLQIDGVNGTLSATVEAGERAVDLVWAAVFAPNFSEPTDVTLNLKVPVVRLEPVAGEPGRFSIPYPNGFTQQGNYRVVFYAQDRQGINAAPVGPGTGLSIYLPAILR